MEHFHSQVVVIGAGVVGLAIGRAFARAGHETLILEKNPRLGMETSGRNSEVIHAGLYPDYPKGSLKAGLCIRGRQLLYDFAERTGVPHRRTGKWLVAASADQASRLDAIRIAARAHGVTELTLLPAEKVRAEEPALRFHEVVSSPLTGIIDSHALMLALLGDAEAGGAKLVCRAPVLGLSPTGGGWQLQVGGAEPAVVESRLVINSAGLWAQGLAARIDGLAPALVPPLHLAKGNYLAYHGAVPFRRLIYPMPEPGGLGVHLTLDLAGQGRLGPNVEWLEGDDPSSIDYVVPTSLIAGFAQAARAWWPDLNPDRLSPAYSGVRPKLAGRAQSEGVDFRIDGPGRHGLAGLVNLFGIESPGLTASLAIAEHVMGLLRDG
jgi:L-2-hydroxyglutarate oxidase LhgO